MVRTRQRSMCCWCIPLRVATFIGGLLIGAFGGAGTYLFFTHKDLPMREYQIGGFSIAPFSSGNALWYYTAAVSVFAAAVGAFGMLSALLANRRMVKAFEAFYVLSLMTQFAFIAWLIIYFKSRQSDFDNVCNASKDGLFDMPLVPSFAADWSCQKLFTASVLTMGIGGLIWIAINFFMTNRVIHYARELFTARADRYKVLGEAATKELDREQQIPLNYTNVGTGPSGRQDVPDHVHNMHYNPQPSYRDEIEYKDPRFDDGYQTRDAGYNPYGPQSNQQNLHQPPVAQGFNRRDSQQGMDLVNPYYDQNETIPQPPPPQTTATTTAAAVVTPATTTPVGSLGAGAGAGQSFTYATTNKIASPFDDDDGLVTAPVAPALDTKIPPAQSTTLEHQESSHSILSPTTEVTSSSGQAPSGSEESALKK